MTRRHALRLEGDLRSDVAPVNDLVREARRAGGEDVVAMKDPTRGGLASTLHEMAGKAGVGIALEDAAVPMSAEVRAAAEVLGIDPYHVANEGKAVIGVRPGAADRVLAALRAHPLGRRAAVVGTAIAERPGSVILDTGLGGRLLAEIEGEPLPRLLMHEYSLIQSLVGRVEAEARTRGAVAVHRVVVSVTLSHHRPWRQGSMCRQASAASLRPMTMPELAKAR